MVFGFDPSRSMHIKISRHNKSPKLRKQRKLGRCEIWIHYWPTDWLSGVGDAIASKTNHRPTEAHKQLAICNEQPNRPTNRKQQQRWWSPCKEEEHERQRLNMPQSRESMERSKGSRTERQQGPKVKAHQPTNQPTNQKSFVQTQKHGVAALETSSYLKTIRASKCTKQQVKTHQLYEISNIYQTRQQ